LAATVGFYSCTYVVTIVLRMCVMCVFMLEFVTVVVDVITHVGVIQNHVGVYF